MPVVALALLCEPPFCALAPELALEGVVVVVEDVR